MKKLKIFLILLVLGVLGGDIFLYYKSNGLKENNVKIENSIEEYEEIVEKIHYYESWLNDSDHTLEFHKELEEKKNALLEQKKNLENEIELLELNISNLD